MSVFENSLLPLARSSKSRYSSLPDWLNRCTDYALYAIIAGGSLYLSAFITNSVPDPSFPWATLPASLRLPFTQPRIEHWPITYTIGIWLFVFSLPFLFFAVYRRYETQRNSPLNVWFTVLPVLTMFGFTTYCRFFWPKLYPASWNAPSYTFVCWAYCSSYVPFWSDLAYAVVFLGAGSAYLAYQDSPWAKYGLAAWGILAFPLGIPALYEANRRCAEAR